MNAEVTDDEGGESGKERDMQRQSEDDGEGEEMRNNMHSEGEKESVEGVIRNEEVVRIET